MVSRIEKEMNAEAELRLIRARRTEPVSIHSSSWMRRGCCALDRDVLRTIIQSETREPSELTIARASPHYGSLDALFEYEATADRDAQMRQYKRRYIAVEVCRTCGSPIMRYLRRDQRRHFCSMTCQVSFLARNGGRLGMRLNPQAVRVLRALRGRVDSRLLARLHGITRAHLYAVWHRESWGWVN